MQPASEGRMQFRSHGLPWLSIILSVIEELFGFRYNLMQSQVFCAFCCLLSPAFLHARFGAEPVHGPRGLPVPLGWCTGSCLQLSMGRFQLLSHTPLFPALQLFQWGLPRFGALPVHLHHQASTNMASCSLLGASPRQLG